MMSVASSVRPKVHGLPMQRDDRALLIAITENRDRGAFGDLFERHGQQAYNLACHIMHDSALAQDAVQDAMLTIWSSTKHIPEHTNVRGWILSIVTTKCLNLRRQRSRRAKREDSASMNQRSLATPDEKIEADELLATLKTHLENLPELDSLLLACCFGADMPHRQIADVVGIPQQRVSEKIQQALARLRTSLSNAGVAAVVPLVSAEALRQAITTGHPCPPGMSTRLLQSLDEAGRASVRALSRRVRRGPSAASTRSPMLAIGGAAALATLIAGAMWLSKGTPPAPAKTTPAQTQTPTISELPALPAEKPIYKRWSFEKGPPSDLKPIQSSWTWSPDNGGMMVPARDVQALIPLPVEISNVPVLITMKTRNPGLPNGGYLMFRQTGHTLSAHRMWTKPFEAGGRPALDFTIYDIGQHQICIFNREVTGVSEYTVEKHSLLLGLHNLDVQEIVIKSIAPSDIPEFLRDVPQRIKELEAEPHNSPEIRLPDSN